MKERVLRKTGIALALLLAGAALAGCAVPVAVTARTNGGSPWESVSPGVSWTVSPAGGPAAPSPAPEDPAKTQTAGSTPETAGAGSGPTATFYEPPEPSASPSAAPGFATAAPAGAPARTATVTPAVAPTTFPTPSAPTSTDGGGFYSESLKADEMFGLVNQARAAAGLPAYTWDATLVPPAMKHCRDMAENNFFSHTSPTWGGFSARAAASGVSATILGENLAYVTGYAGTAAIAHELLMDSEGHRANILSEKFTRIGIAAVYDAGDDVCYFVQWFAG
jgi:uncharacterized protein YkwD